MELAAHALIVGTVLLTALTVFDGSLFAWHPTLMVLGYLGLLSEASLAALRFRELLGQQRSTAIWQHATLAILGCFSIAAGYAAIYVNKARPLSLLVYRTDVRWTTALIAVLRTL